MGEDAGYAERTKDGKDIYVMFELKIPGNPAPWCVYIKRGPPPIGFQHMRAWQQQIQFYLSAEWGDREPLSGPVCLDIELFLPWPDSAPQKQAKAIETWYWKHLAMKPDRTNLFKAFEDACQKILFHGDQQVVRGEARKDILRPTVYTQCKEGYTVVRFRPMEKP